MALLGECRCCRKPIDRSRLACSEHWDLLPQHLKTMIRDKFERQDWMAYSRLVAAADEVWQDLGLWKPGVPMSTRAARGVEILREAAGVKR